MVVHECMEDFLLPSTVPHAIPVIALEIVLSLNTEGVSKATFQGAERKLLSKKREKNFVLD